MCLCQIFQGFARRFSTDYFVFDISISPRPIPIPRCFASASVFSAILLIFGWLILIIMYPMNPLVSLSFPCSSLPTAIVTGLIL